MQAEGAELQGGFRRFSFNAVARVPDDGMPSQAQMAPDLMESAGAQEDVDTAAVVLRGMGCDRDYCDGLFAVQRIREGHRLSP